MADNNQRVHMPDVRETSSSPDYSAYRDDVPRASADRADAPSFMQQPPPRRSTTGSPRNSTDDNRCSIENSSSRPSTIKARRASVGNPNAYVTAGPVPLRRRRSIKHPYSLHLSATPAADGAHVEATHLTPAQEQQRSKTYTDDVLFRASPHGRRHAASVAVLSRDEANAAAPVNTTVSASPDRSAGALPAPVATTQEDVKRYVTTVMSEHAATLGTWEQRVTVAEIYRDKPLRTGGRPAPLRVQDRGFLERVLGSLVVHLKQLSDARSLLQQTRKDVPRSKAGGYGDVDAWDEYCSCYDQTLIDLTSEAQQMRKRVVQLLRADEQDGVRTHRTRAGSVPQPGSGRASRARSQGSNASRRSSPQATPRGRRPTLAEEERRNAHDGPPQASHHHAQGTDASPHHHGERSNGNGSRPTGAVNDRNPYVPLLGGGAVQRGSQAIRPGYKSNSESAMRTSPVPESHRSWTRASSVQNPPRDSVGSAQSLTSSRSRQQARALHPDTVVRLSVPTANPNDMRSPYGRLMSPKRASSPLRDPSHAVLIVPPPADFVAEMNEAQAEAETSAPVTARSSRASRASRASRTSRAVSSTNPVYEVPPQLRTYSSPRGSARTASPTSTTPFVHPLRRRQLLEVIEHYEKNSTTLQRGDLHRARECFYELYGEQQGLRQYCLWIDDIALLALRVPQGSV